MPLNELGIAKRNLVRSRWHCERMQRQLGWIYDHYIDEHPDFAEHVFVAARFAKELDAFVASILDELNSM